MTNEVIKTNFFPNYEENINSIYKEIEKIQKELNEILK